MSDAYSMFCYGLHNIEREGIKLARLYQGLHLLHIPKAR